MLASIGDRDRQDHPATGLQTPRKDRGMVHGLHDGPGLVRVLVTAFDAEAPVAADGNGRAEITLAAPDVDVGPRGIEEQSGVLAAPGPLGDRGGEGRIAAARERDQQQRR
jgi:hypothetical protein